MRKPFREPVLGKVEDAVGRIFSQENNHTLRYARVMIVQASALKRAAYVGVNFVPKPTSAPLGVTTMWEASGVDLARFAMAHGKQLLILYRGLNPAYAWQDIIELCAIDFQVGAPQSLRRSAAREVMRRPR